MSQVNLCQSLLSAIADELGNLRQQGIIDYKFVSQYSLQEKHLSHSIMCGAISTACRKVGYIPMLELGWYRPPSTLSYLQTTPQIKRGGEFKPDLSLLNPASKTVEVIIEYESLNSSDERQIDTLPQAQQPRFDKRPPDEFNPKMKHLVNCAHYALTSPSHYQGEPYQRRPTLLILLVTLPDVPVQNHKTSYLDTKVTSQNTWKEIFWLNKTGRFAIYNYRDYLNQIRVPPPLEICLSVIDQAVVESWFKTPISTTASQFPTVNW
jgi:hypothetical protein